MSLGVNVLAEDRVAIQDVLLRYAAGADDRDLAMYRSCFADDVEIIGFSGGTVTGADIWVETVQKKLAAFAETQHHMTPVLARIDGDRATARTDVQALHYLEDKPGSTMTLWATYLTDLVRTPDGWKITRHELVRRGTRTAEA